MALIIKDRVKEVTTTTGTGAVSLGGASATFDAFQSVMSNGDTTFYAIVHTASGTDEWEVGLGTWNTGNTLTRTTVYAGSNGTSAVNFSSGNKDIFMTYPASKAAVAGEDVTFADVTATNITATGTVTLAGDPTSALQAATKEYVDTIAAAGIHYHTPVRVEAPSALTATYDNGTSGVGATLTNSGTQAALVIDGVTLSTSDRVLVYNQTNAAHNGIYTVTNTGSASTNWVLTRATDADSYGASDPDALGEGDAYFVKEGDTGAGELYVMNTSGVITFGTTAITFTVIAETAVYSAGTGLTLTGTTFSTNQDISTSASPTFNNITVTGTVDGRDVATDGSKLDGIEAGATADQTASEIKTAYESNSNTNAFTDAEQTKLSGIETGATGDQTASEILTAIKTVDGAASGLDADLLDGQQGSYYLNTSTTFSGDVSGTYNNIVVTNDSHTHDGRYYTETEADSRFVNVTGDTMTGGLTISSGSDLVLSTSGTDIGDIVWSDSSGEKHRLWDGGTGLNYRYRAGTSYLVFHDGYHPNADKWTTARTLSLSGDASGSVSWDGSANATLSVSVGDADTLDGQHGSYYARKAYWPDVDTNLGDTHNPLLTFSSVSDYSKPAGFQTMLRSASTGLPSGHGQSYFGYTVTSKRDTGGGYSALLTAYDGSELWFTYTGSSSSTPSWNKVWHNNNDGSGSGLDADLLDGIQGSSFLRSDAADTASGDITFTGGAGAISVGAGSDLRFTTGNWTGEYSGKIQYHSSHFYFQSANQWIFRNSSASNVMYGDQSGNWTAAASLRSPLYYDSNDTAYYVNPNAGSVLRGSVVIHDNGSSSPLIDIRSDDGGPWAMRLYRDDLATGTQVYLKNATTAYWQHTVEAGSDFRAPIFYDSNDTAYYVDPAGSTSAVFNGEVEIRGPSGTTHFNYNNDGGNNYIRGYATYFDQNQTYVNDLRAKIMYDWDNTGYYVNPASTSTIYDLNVINKRSDFGQSSNWDYVGFSNLTNVHMQGHDYFWIGAGNGTWFTGTGNTKSQVSGLAADASSAHDLLITTMYSTSTTDRGITFAVESNGNGNNGWRLGKWHSGDARDSSKLTIDGGLHVMGGYTDNYSYYADDYSSYYSARGGQAYWGGDSGWNDPSITAAHGIQIQSGNTTTNSQNPQLQFHQYGYGGVQFRYDGPNDRMYLESTGSDRMDWFRVKTDHGYIDIGPANTSWAHIYTDRAAFYLDSPVTVLNGSRINSGDIRASIFYDVDNTAYYINANGESSLSSALVGSYIKFGNSTYSGGRIDWNYNSNNMRISRVTGISFDWGTGAGNSDGYTYHGIASGDAGGTAAGDMKIASRGDIHFRIDTDSNATNNYIKFYQNGVSSVGTLMGLWGGGTSTGQLSVYGSISCPIYYDSNDTAYYVNPNSASHMHTLQLQGPVYSRGDTDTRHEFHAADQWRVVVGGSERLEVKNSSPHVLVTGDLNSTSDKRLKENVAPITNALADVTQLEGVSFDWKDTGTRGHGFIAQQVEPILPDVVNTDEETGMKSINYVGMIGHLVEAIKELKAEIEELKGR